MEKTMTLQTDRIRDLNDALRKNLTGGSAVITCGVAALGEVFVARIVRTIAAFDDFHHANDPHSEHDFGAVEVDGYSLFFKIDYYDLQMSAHSPDPADPSVTQRVITTMLAEEY
jgi:hypothetical protein